MYNYNASVAIARRPYRIDNMARLGPAVSSQRLYNRHEELTYKGQPLVLPTPIQLALLEGLIHRGVIVSFGRLSFIYHH